jgi:hypothetical protein
MLGKNLVAWPTTEANLEVATATPPVNGIDNRRAGSRRR